MKNARIKHIIDALLYEQVNYEGDNKEAIKESIRYRETLKKEENDTDIERKNRANKKIV